MACLCNRSIIDVIFVRACYFTHFINTLMAGDILTIFSRPPLETPLYLPLLLISKAPASQMIVADDNCYQREHSVPKITPPGEVIST